MDWNVPCFPEASDVLCVPPVTVELSVSETKDLRCHIHHGVEHPVEAKQPEEVVRDLDSGTAQLVQYITKYCRHRDLGTV